MSAPIPPAPTTPIDPGFTIGAKLPVLPKAKLTTPGGTIGASVSTLPFALCGYKIPSVGFGFSFTIPRFTIDLNLLLGLSLGIDCAGILSGHPLNFTADVPWGGGRVGTHDPDPDDEVG
jgi:hypothetical protein